MKWPLLLVGLVFFMATIVRGESLPPIDRERPPKNLEELWGAYDPRKEPLDVEIVRQWREGDLTLRVVRFTVGTFKGKPSKLAAFYAFPSQATSQKLPAILHIHGGGGRAELSMVRYAADNGYAGLSINWGGRAMEGAQEGEANTEWGAIDPTQQTHNSHYASMAPDDRTLDVVESPRNNNWFLLILAARRALTFLELQPEVDGTRLGVTGHSMGGKLTTNLTGIDQRVKASSPSCGGAGTVSGAQSGMPGFVIKDDSDWFNATIADNPYIDRITAPILFCSPTNDFAGPLDNMYFNWRNLKQERVRYAISPHLNHRHRSEFHVAQLLWFEQHLKGTFTFPATPGIEVTFDTADGVPQVTVRPDGAKPVERVDIYYSVDPQVLTRFWRDAQAKQDGGTGAWRAKFAHLADGQPLFVFANVTYKLEHPVIEERIRKPYQGPFAISSQMLRYSSDQLKKQGVRFSSDVPDMIDDFSRGWHDWYQINWGHPPLWQAHTRKLKDPLFRGPKGAKLAMDVRSTHANKLVIGVMVNDWGAFGPGGSSEYLVEKSLAASPDWQTIVIDPADFDSVSRNGKASDKLGSWSQVTELRIGAGGATVLKDGKTVQIGNQHWHGEREFRNLRWIR